jgi:hypothetical protein
LPITGGDDGPAGEAAPGVLVEGKPCSAGSECRSGFCFDGVCCKSDCSSPCQSCASAENLGTCLPAEVGTDPRDECPTEGVPSCGTDGVCDGAGACRKYPTGIVCRAATCTGSTQTLAGRCDGLGSCQASTEQTCAPYACGAGGACLIACATSADCVAGNVCTAQSCGKQPLGAACTMPEQCNSGFCQQGVCCGAACSGVCRSCAVTGSQGMCVMIPAGEDPLAQCPEDGAAGCARDGTCDGAGACRLYASGTQCAAPSCAGSTFTPRRTCNGSGTCQAAIPSSCGAYNCAATGACLTTCTTSADCATGNICTASSCGPACTAQYNFEGGTTQGFINNIYANRAFGAPASTAVRALCGTRAIAMTASFAVDPIAEIYVDLPAATSFTGLSISFHVYIDGPALPAGSAVQGLLINGITSYFTGGYTQSIGVGRWITITYALDATATRVGMQLLLPSAQAWSGTVYLDEFGWR